MNTETPTTSTLYSPPPIILHPDMGFQHISVVFDEADDYIKKIGEGLIKPFITHSKMINTKIGGVMEAEQMVIAARTGVGKSAFLNWWLDAMADQTLNPGKLVIFLYWSIEMKAWRQIIRIYSHNSHKDYELGIGKALSVKDILSYNDPVEQEILERLWNIRKLMENRPVYFREASATAEQWQNVVADIQEMNPEYTIVNLWDHTRLVHKANEKSEEERITNLMSSGMLLKNKISCINIWLSQMNRNIESASNGQEIGKRPPVSSDIFGSDAVQQFADLVLAPHRPENYNVKLYLDQFETKDLFALHVLKQRDGWTGMIRMKHNLQFNTFKDWIDEGEDSDTDY